MPGLSITLCSHSGSCENSRVIPEHFNVARFTNPVAAHNQYFNEINFDETQAFIDAHKKHYLAGYISYSAGEKFQSIDNHLYQPLKNFPAIALWAFEDMVINDSLPVADIQDDNNNLSKIRLQALTTKSTYLKKLGALKDHIQKGDIYEINYCIGFEANNVDIDSTEIWQRLQRISPMPFSALLESDEYVIISASPERFLHQNQETLYSQPMKGTLAKSSLSKDESIRLLKYNAKERAENVMIVDLTRNDFSKLAIRNSVHVNELFGVYEFQTIYQMVSTVSAKLKHGLSFTDILSATFPMGSMTGAPKKRAMELIAQYEDFNRGVFSGSLGYISPNGIADFNVLIRTIFYDKKSRKLFVAAGSAITSGSDPEKEYEECLIKLQPLLKALRAEI